MSENLSVLLVAVGGYGANYVTAMLDRGAAAGARIAGVVDPFADRAKRIDEIRALGVPIVEDMETFYRDHHADLAVISSPIHLHCEHVCCALAHGSHVLCEKPLGATVQQGQCMIAAREQAGRLVAIGYQWSFNEAIQQLKADILHGDFGAPRRLRTLVLWPRTEAYYGRNGWAGARADAQGNLILDSPVNNATAHYLHNMFYVLGERIDRSAMPRRVSAELYRANPIDNYDTGVCRAVTDGGVEVLFYASHTVPEVRGPEFVYEFEQGTVSYGGRASHITARLADGSTRTYGDPQVNVQNKLWHTLAAVRGQGGIACGLEAALAQTLCMNGMQESVPHIEPWPAECIRVQGDTGNRLTVVDGLAKGLTEAYIQGKLPAELGLSWARRGKDIDLQGYTNYPRK